MITASVMKEFFLTLKMIYVLLMADVETFLRPVQTSVIKLFVKIVHGF